MDAPIKPLSKQNMKRIRALHTVAINQMTDGKERALKDASAELQESRKREDKLVAELKYAKQMLQNSCALLEAVVRRHGKQVFDRSTVESVCARGQIKTEALGDRITLSLRDKPTLVDSLDSE